MVEDKYSKILNRFKLQYPNFYSRAIDWWASGRMCITVKLDSGDMLEYNQLDDNIRWIQRLVDTKDDEARRKMFGSNLQKMIPFSGLSKSEFAETLGITNAMLSRYLHGTSMPSADRAYQIARVLGCTVEELFDDTYMEG